MLYLLVMGSLVAFTVYGWMLRVAPLPLVATYAYVNPVVAVILGAIILNEPIDLRTIVAGAIIVTVGGGHRHRAEPHAGGPAAAGRRHDPGSRGPRHARPAATAAPTR